MPKDPDLISTEEVARMFGASPRTVAKWAKKGLLPAETRTPGGHRRWKRSEVEEFRNRPADPGVTS